MGKYPWTYEEYEKEVYKRFSELPWEGYTKEEKIEMLDKFIKEEYPGFIRVAYKTSCAGYDRSAERWRSLGTSEEQIKENFMEYPMNNLELIFSGG